VGQHDGLARCIVQGLIAARHAAGEEYGDT